MVRWISLITLIMLPALGCDSTSVSTAADDLIGWNRGFEREANRTIFGISRHSPTNLHFQGPHIYSDNTFWVITDTALTNSL